MKLKSYRISRINDLSQDLSSIYKKTIKIKLGLELIIRIKGLS